MAQRRGCDPPYPPLSLFDRQPIRRSLPPFALGILVAGSRLLDWPSPCCSPIWPTRSQQCHNRPPIYTPSTPPPAPALTHPCLLSPPARWERTHARCLINTETKPALPGSLRGVLRDIQLSHGLSQNGSARGVGGFSGGKGTTQATNEINPAKKPPKNDNNPKNHSGTNPAADKNNTHGRKKTNKTKEKTGQQKQRWNGGLQSEGLIKDFRHE